MSMDVEREIREYATWLEQQVGLTMRPPADVDWDTSAATGRTCGPLRGLRLVVVASCLGAVVAAVWLLRQPAEIRIAQTVAPTIVNDNGQDTVDSPVATPGAGSVFNRADPAGLDELVGRWSDGVNTFAFASDGTLTFTLDRSCDGTFVLSAQGELDVSFGQCDSSSVHLTAPIFRRAKVYRVGNSLYLDGNAGVFRIDLTGEGQS